MDLSLNSTDVDNSVLSKIYSAQLIANTFAKGLEDNDCLLISLVQLHDKINSNYKDITDNKDNYDPPPQVIKQKINSNYPGPKILNPIVQDLVKNAKGKFFDF